MLEPWEVFYHTWAAAPGAAERHAAAPARAAEAIATAAQATIDDLRHQRQWAWISAHLLVGHLVDTAVDWLVHGGADAAQLQARLERVWQSERHLALSEATSRELTEAVLA